MPERAWLEGYSGQSVEQLLELEGSHRIDSLVVAFEEAIQQKMERDGIEALTTEEVTVLAVEALEREVNHGGYHYFFATWSAQFAPVVVEALRRIGCPQTAAITQHAIDALHLPYMSVVEIEVIINSKNEFRDQELGKCDERFFAYPEPIADRLFALIKESIQNNRLLHGRGRSM